MQTTESVSYTHLDVYKRQGKASKQIADILGITKNTVDNHRQRLLKKFGVHSSAELVIKAMNL